MHDTHQRAVLTVYCPAGVGTDRLVKSAPSRRLEMSQTFISSRIHATDRTMKHTFWYKMNKKKAKTVPIKNEKKYCPGGKFIKAAGEGEGECYSIELEKEKELDRIQLEKEKERDRIQLQREGTDQNRTGEKEVLEANARRVRRAGGRSEAKAKA